MFFHRLTLAKKDFAVDFALYLTQQKYLTLKLKIFGFLEAFSLSLVYSPSSTLDLKTADKRSVQLL